MKAAYDVSQSKGWFNIGIIIDLIPDSLSYID